MNGKSVQFLVDHGTKENYDQYAILTSVTISMCKANICGEFDMLNYAFITSDLI